MNLPLLLIALAAFLGALALSFGERAAFGIRDEWWTTIAAVVFSTVATIGVLVAQ